MDDMLSLTEGSCQQRPNYFYPPPEAQDAPQYQQPEHNQPVAQSIGHPSYGHPQTHFGCSAPVHSSLPSSSSGAHYLQQLIIQPDAIRAAKTNQIIFDIIRPGKKSFFPSSGQPAITIGRLNMAPPLGTVHAHRSSQDVDVTVHGRATTIKHDFSSTERWYYRSISGAAGTFWWSKHESLSLDDEDDECDLEDSGRLEEELEDISDTWILKDAKKGGRVIARLQDDLLTFPTRDLSQAVMDEVMISAVGMSEAIKWKKKQDDFVTKIVLKSLLGGVGA